jgi:hypothetical protein
MLIRVSSSFVLTLIPLGRVIMSIAVRSLAIAYFLVLLSLHGSQRRKQLYHALVPRRNFGLFLLLHQRLYGFVGYWLILVFNVIHPRLFFVTVVLLFKLPMILSSMSWPNTLVWMLPSPNPSVNNLLLSSSMSRQSFKLQISSPRLKPEINIGFILSYLVYQMLLTHLKFEGGC